jgi:nicotinamide mononucleotide transporter
MNIMSWLSANWIELFGAATGIIFVFLEIRQNILLWPVGIVTSAVYIWIFFHGKLYADMSLQAYYLVISFIGWYWWLKGTGHRPSGEKESNLEVSSVTLRLSAILAFTFIVVFLVIYFLLFRLTDSPVPAADSFITSLSIIATWMLARKIIEHWYLWIIVNLFATILFLFRELYPTALLYFVYGMMSYFGLKEWKKSLQHRQLTCS